MNTIAGIVADELGVAFDPATPRLAWRSPCSGFRSVQAREIPVDFEHDGRPVGQVVHLERTRSSLWAVAEVDARPVIDVRVADELIETPVELYLSAQRVGADDDLVLLGLGLTRSPARIGARATPPHWYPGELSNRSSWQFPNEFQRKLITRAAEAKRGRHGRPIVVHDDQPRPRVAPPAARARWIEHRAAGAVDIHASRRELEVLIAPAEQPAEIFERGRSYVEVFAFGAFDGVEKHPERVLANIQHDRGRLIGRAIRLDAWAEAGLEGTIKLARVRDADEALELLADQLLSVSAGFLVAPHGERWRGNERRITHGLLDHVALVDRAAHAGARVTAVRVLADR